MEYTTIEKVVSVIENCKTQLEVLKALVQNHIVTRDASMRSYVTSFMATLPER
jgi:hypothetical protein